MMAKSKMSIADIEAKMARGEAVEIATDGAISAADPQARLDRLNEAFKDGVRDRIALKKELSALRAAFQQPYIDTTRINDLQMDSIRQIIPRLKQAHFTNLRIRINGEYEEVECDWLKHLVVPNLSA